jgi:hypothetical protein
LVRTPEIVVAVVERLGHLRSRPQGVTWPHSAVSTSARLDLKRQPAFARAPAAITPAHDGDHAHSSLGRDLRHGCVGGERPTAQSLDGGRRSPGDGHPSSQSTGGGALPRMTRWHAHRAATGVPHLRQFMSQCDRREQLQQHLAERGAQMVVHYNKPIHLHSAAQPWRVRCAQFD